MYTQLTHSLVRIIYSNVFERSEYIPVYCSDINQRWSRYTYVAYKWKFSICVTRILSPDDNRSGLTF